MELLGIELDSVTQEARISSARLSSWLSRASCTKRQLQSLIRKLNFVCLVCRPGRTFLRRMINLLSSARYPSHHIRLNKGFLKDITWWMTFINDWNGRSLFYEDRWLSSDCVHLSTDASSTSFGGLFGNMWFCDTFSSVGIPNHRSIAFKELYAITTAVTVWAAQLQSQNVIFHCDNLSVVHILTSGSSRCPQIMSLVRYLFYVCATFNIALKSLHIRGLDNAASDALSRLQVERFRTLVPLAQVLPTPVTRLPLENFK